MFGGKDGATPARVVHLADSPGQVAQHAELAASASGDLTAVLDRRPRRPRQGRHAPDWSAWVADLQAGVTAAAERDAELLGAEADPIHPARIYGELVPRLADDAVVIGDGGDFVSFAGKYVEPKRPGGWLDPGPYGCLGAGLGAAIAARIARPSSQVVLLLGDGAAGFSLMDVDTLVRHDLPVVMVMGNNSAWGLEKGPMQMLYGYDVVADLAHRTRYDEVVKALGGAGETVTDPREIGPALDRAFAAGVAVPRQRDHRRRRDLPAHHLRDLRFGVLIRRATPEDYEAVGELTEAAYEEFLEGPDDYYREALRDAEQPRPRGRAVGGRRRRRRPCWAASPRARPARRGASCRCDGEGEFRMLAVAPAARGRGVGEALVRHCEDRATAAGATRMWLSTIDDMTHAQRIYARLGYRHEPARDWSPRRDARPASCGPGPRSCDGGVT